MNTLKLLRKNKGVSQTEVADAIGVSQVAYGRYESGQREPSFDMLNALADYFGVSVDAVLGRGDTPSFLSLFVQSITITEQGDVIIRHTLPGYSQVVSKNGDIVSAPPCDEGTGAQLVTRYQFRGFPPLPSR